MIFKYFIENFKSIHYCENINFKAHPLKRSIKPLKNNLLSTIAIFGPNGGGKSSVIHSFSFLVNLLKKNEFYFEFYKSYNYIKNFNFLSNEPIKWKIELIDESNLNLILCYELHINNSNIQFEQFSTYELNSYKKPEVYFTRDTKKIKYSKKFNNFKFNFDISRQDLLINFINNTQISDNISIFFKLIKKIYVFANYSFNPIDYINDSYIKYNFNVEYLVQNKNLFLKIFKDIDLNILDLKLKKQILGDEHLVLIKNGNNGNFEIPFILESEGTKKIIQLLVLFIMNINNGSVFVIDELDTNLHTKLIQYIIQMFHEKKINSNSQLIFSSHDMELLSSKILREDEIYFAALNENYFTNLVSLIEFKGVRISNNFAKKYLNGEFGYDPYIDKGMNWKNEK